MTRSLLNELKTAGKYFTTSISSPGERVGAYVAMPLLLWMTRVVKRCGTFFFVYKYKYLLKSRLKLLTFSHSLLMKISLWYTWPERFCTNRKLIKSIESRYLTTYLHHFIRFHFSMKSEITPFRGSNGKPYLSADSKIYYMT